MKSWELNKNGNLVLLFKGESSFAVDFQIILEISSQQRAQILKSLKQNVIDMEKKANGALFNPAIK